MRLHSLSGSIATVWLLVGCQPAEGPRTPLARIDDRVLTVEQLFARFDSSQTPTEAQVQDYVQRWVNDELLYREAVRQGFDRQPELARRLDDVRRQLVISALLESTVYTRHPEDFSREEVERYFEEHKEEFVLPADVLLVSFALFEDRESANAFRTRVLRGASWSSGLEALRGDANRSLSLLARVDSVYFTQQTLFPAELWRVAAFVGRGEPSFPIRTPEGFYVLIVWSAQRQGQRAELPYVEREIRSRLLIERRRAVMDSLLEHLRSKHTIEVLVTPGSPTREPMGLERRP